MDWNEDGLTDLLVGEYDGHIRYYMAVTADSLTIMDDLQAAGEYIDGGLISAPFVFDWNNDSLNDLIVGFASPSSGSTIKVYMNIGTTGNPVLATGVDVQFGGKPLEAYGCTPCMTDLDQDGLTDIVYGETGGGIYFCKNTGTQSSPVFASPEPLQTDEGDISLELNSSPFIADWNDDGYPDLVAGCGEAGYIYAFLSPWTTGISSGEDTNRALTVNVLQNPVSSSISVEVVSDESRLLNISLYSLAGRLTQNLGTKELQGGMNSLHLDILPHPPGIYLLRLASEDAVTSKLLTVIGGVQ